MSIEASNRVWKYSKSKGSERLIMLCLANYTNNNGLAWPTFSTISRDTGVSERQITRAIATLEASGELAIVEKGDGRGRSTVYKITIKGDVVSTFDETEKGDMVSIKGDISSKKVDTLSVKGDMVSPQPLEPLTENHKEPLRGEVPPPNPFPFVPLGKVRNTEPTAADLRAQAIAFVCGLRLSVPRHRERCYNAAAQLNEFTPEYIIERYSSETGHWRMNDWRGRKGNMPTPEQCVDEITTVAHAPKLSSNGHHAPERPVTIDPTMPKPGQGGVW